MALRATLPLVERCALLDVEDEDACAFLFRAALDQAGIAVSVYRVSDGERALAFLDKSGVYKMARRPGVVVMDLNMPRIDGWAVLSTIQANRELRGIPVVVLSTSFRQEDQKRSLALGARRYVVKPSTFDKLVREVELICSDFLPVRAESGPSTIFNAAA